jgi:hypothetical protein
MVVPTRLFVWLSLASCMSRDGFEDIKLVECWPECDALAFASAVMADSPTVYWRLEETSGAYRDEMGTHDSVDLQVSARGVAATSTAVGLGAGLDGTSDAITFADHDDFEVGAGPFTIEVVAEIDIVGNSFNRLFSHEVYGVDGWYLSMDESWGVAFSRWAGGVEYFAASDIYAPVGSVVHIVGVYDADGQEIRLYMDGALRGVGAASGTVGDVAQSVTLGRPSQFTAQYFAGGIYEAVFYRDQVLSEARVTVHFESLGL